MIPNRSNELLNTFSKHSEALGKDVLNILTKSCKPKLERVCAGHDVTFERLKDLLAYIDSVKTPEQNPYFHQFINEGFSMLDDAIKWASVEQELYLIEQKQIYTRRRGSMLSGLINLAKTHFDNQELWSPSRIASDGRVIDLSQLYLYPTYWVIEFKDLLEKILSKPNGYSRYKSGIGLTLKFFAKARKELVIIRHLNNEKGIISALDDDKIFQILLSKTQPNDHSRLTKLRRAYNSKLYGEEAKFAGRTKYILVAGDELRGAHWIHDLSPLWFEECHAYVSNVYKNDGQRAAISTITRLTKISSALVDHKEAMVNLEQLRRDGISAFFDDEQSLMRCAHQIDDNRMNGTLGQICAMHNYQYGSNSQLSDLYDLVVEFECDSGDDIYRLIILDTLAASYPSVAKSIYDYAQYQLNRIDGYKKSEETVHSTVRMVVAIFTNHLDLLNQDDCNLLASLGLDALVLDNCRIIKRIRSVIRDKYSADTFTFGTARAMQSAFSGFCSHFELPDVKSYAVSGRKRQANEEKNKATDYYSIEDVASIAYAIELGLKDKTLKQKDELLLRLGRVLLKTGWNLSPVMMLEIDDIMKLDAPVTGKAAHFIRLFKKRAQYKTQFYEFELDEDGIRNEGLVFGTCVTNALTDLEYIRDKISSELRPHLENNSKLKYQLSLYRDDDGKIRSPTQAKFTSLLSNVLIRYECDISFNVRRIRKGGLNYIYKTYSKKFKEYHKAGQHSLRVFLDVYLRNDGLKSEETIASASTIMSDYFTGRPISEDIIIVTEIPADTKQTPTGRCASKGNDAESDAFIKQNQRLARESGSENTQCGDFNACLFCRHFRLVADAEHVWRLLSYHHYVLGEMERGISDYDNSTDQSKYVELLSNRVQIILAELSEINNDAVNAGRHLLKTKGCHEDWTFVADVGVG